MSNQNNIKKMFDKKFNIETMRQEILLKERNEKMNINKVLKCSVVPICLIGVISIFLILNKDILFYKNNSNIYINKVDEINNLSDIDGKAVDITLKEAYEVYPEIENISIPSDLKNVRNIKIYSRKDLTEDYTILDGYSVMYDNDVTKSIDIFMSRTLKERRRCRSIIDNSYRPSFINGTNLTIVSFGDDNIVNFKYKNIYFDIETSNVTQEELIDLLTSIIK